ncbi:hypothetical protein LJC32_05370 [Oscillospiraceae bacterium OttesenSCG-928-F05]|nr:hypothetical protein [Oscillospiraceae bacterium OttesenSCG-928-F05]
MLTQAARDLLARHFPPRRLGGAPSETAEALFRRVAKAAASAEALWGGDAAAAEERFFAALSALEFLPDARILREEDVLRHSPAPLRVDDPDIVNALSHDNYQICLENTGSEAFFGASLVITQCFLDAIDHDGVFSLRSPEGGETAGELQASTVVDLMVSSLSRSGSLTLLFDGGGPGWGPALQESGRGGVPAVPPWDAPPRCAVNLMAAALPGGEGLDWDALARTVGTALRFLDNYLDTAPLAAAAPEAREWRYVGLGVMGFAELLLILGLDYRSEEAADFASRLMAFIHGEVRRTGMALARARGPFPQFSHSPLREGPPLRNAGATFIAPMAAQAAVAGVTDGISPLFICSDFGDVTNNDAYFEINSTVREILSGRGARQHSALRRPEKTGALADNPSCPPEIPGFVTARDVSPEALLRMQAAFQRYTDGPVLSPIHLPGPVTREALCRLIFTARDSGCRALTLHREG